MKKLIVGLGNPGTKYKYTRHNTGFIVVDSIAADYGAKKWIESAKFDAKYIKLTLENGDIVFLLKPQAFMNESGKSVQSFVKYNDIPTENIAIIHDDLDLPLLEIKKQKEAGSAGHNGVENIIQKMGTKDFWRIRIGIGRPKNKNVDISDWVLSNFSSEELNDLLKKVENIKELILSTN